MCRYMKLLHMQVLLKEKKHKINFQNLLHLYFFEILNYTEVNIE